MSHKTNTRISVRCNSDEKQQLEYWSKKLDISPNQLLKEAVEYYIKYITSDFDVSDKMTVCIDQLVNGFHNLASNVQTSIDIQTAGIDSLMALSRGDTYLLESVD